jgi:hypothetical protein
MPTVSVNERDLLNLFNYDFHFFNTRFNGIIIIKMYIRTIFCKFCKAFSNIQRIKCRNITLKGYVLGI